MNKLILMGNLTRDPETSYARDTNTPITRFSVAVNRKYSKDNESDFFNCTAFGKTAEFVDKYFHKGQRILLTGRVENDNYTNKNGEKVYSVRVVVEEVEFGEKKGSGANNNNNNDTPAPPPSGDNDFVPVPDNAQGSIPFFQNEG